MIFFSIYYFTIDYLVYKMSENTEKCPSQVSGAQGDIVNLLVFFPTVENQRVFTMTM